MCAHTAAQVSRPANRVVPISLYAVGGPMWRVLRGYKDAQDEDLRAAYQAQVAELVGSFLARNGSIIAGGRSWDAITTVSSTRHRAGDHPLTAALRQVTHGVITTLRPGSVRLDHGQAHDRGFEPITDVRGRALLLVDDTYTTGARVQSAVSALQIGGADVVAVVVVGRSLRQNIGRPLMDTIGAPILAPSPAARGVLAS